MEFAAKNEDRNAKRLDRVPAAIARLDCAKPGRGRMSWGQIAGVRKDGVRWECWN